MLGAIILHAAAALLGGIFYAVRCLCFIFTALYVAHAFELHALFRPLFVTTEKDANNPFPLAEMARQGHSDGPTATDVEPDLLESANWINRIMEWFIFNVEDSNIARLVQERLVRKLEAKLGSSSVKRLVVSSKRSWCGYLIPFRLERSLSPKSCPWGPFPSHNWDKDAEPGYCQPGPGHEH